MYSIAYRLARTGVKPVFRRCQVRENPEGPSPVWCRRSNRPGKLSGARTGLTTETLERSRIDIRDAEGITISGERTEGASERAA
jgi:hypothetical protein